MNTNDIKTVYFNNNEVVALYKGNSLIYSKQSEEPIPTYNPKLLKGKFTDDSTEDDWWWRPIAEPFTGETTVLQLNDYVDPNTKEFEYEIDFKFNNVATLFEGNSKLERIDSIPDISALYGMSKVFKDCSSLKSVDASNFTVDKMITMTEMFKNCTSLQLLNISNWNTVKVISGNDMFKGCTSLTTVKGKNNVFAVDFVLSDSPLTNKSAMVFINGLSDVASTKKITFKRTTYDTLTEEQIAMATSKGWSIIRG